MAYLAPIQFQLKDKRTVTLRSLSKEDAPLAQAFNDQIGLESTGTMRYPGQKPHPVEDVAKSWAASEEESKEINIGAFDGSRIVAILFFRVAANHPWHNHAGHFGMMVLKEFWGQGLGRKLLRLQEEFARSVGFEQIGAKVRDNNKRAFGLYESEGYQVTGRILRDAKINGEYIDSLIIVKLLDA